MQLRKFDYNLPNNKIAKHPPKNRGESNLMVVNRQTQQIHDKKYSNIVDYLEKGDILVLNNTKVEKVRVFLFNERNKKEIQALFLNRIYRGSSDIETWECILARAKNIDNEDLLSSKNKEVKIEVESKVSSEIFLVSFSKGNSEELFQAEGHVPLPPYLRRDDVKEDYVRYNTVYAKKEGSAAAPTAGLNVTEKLINSLVKKGVEIVEVSLDVGWGTFAPIRTEKIEDHKIHTEKISVSRSSAKNINRVINNGGKIWALGTTAARTLESVSVEEDSRFLVSEFTGETDIYIYPGYEWKIVDGLITNFHAPKSSLIVMISSFMGYDLTMKAYEKALEGSYRFLSYGDTMLIQ